MKNCKTKNKETYYSLPTVRKFRRMMKKVLKSFHIIPVPSQFSSKVSSSSTWKGILVIRDEHGANILKTRRWKNRIKTKSLK